MRLDSTGLHADLLTLKLDPRINFSAERMVGGVPLDSQFMRFPWLLIRESLERSGGRKELLSSQTGKNCQQLN